MIYLDNASTTNKKPLCVKLAVFKSLLKKYCANPGRSSHKASINAGNVVFETRELLKNFFNCPSPENVIFTSGCTEALNLAILGTAKNGGHIIYTSNEHNSVARPIEYLKSKGIITATIINAGDDGKIDAYQIQKAIKPQTYLVVVNHTSNVTGATSDISQIGKICKQHNLMFLVDGAQSAGHKKIDMQKDNISMLAVAGHKGLLAMQGIGVLLFNKNIKISPLKFGGTGTFSEQLLPPISYPESLEAGTGATPAIFSLNAGIKYLNKNFDKINHKIETLTKYLLDELYCRSYLTIFTCRDCYNGVVSFKVKNCSNSDVVDYLNSHNICVRAGLHCAPLCHKNLGTPDGGTIRVSLSSFNTKRHIKKFLNALDNYAFKNLD